MKDEEYYQIQGYESFYPIADQNSGDLIKLVQDGYFWDGEHHKQWFFEQIAAKLGVILPVIENKGIAP